MKLFIFLIGINCAFGATYNDLRVKFGWSGALENREYFFKIPRTVKEAEADGWKRTERPPGPIPELRLYCSQGRYICPLYDAAGFVAGLQVALPVDAYESFTQKPERFLVKWQAPVMEGEPAREYWTATQYYVSEENLKAGAGPQIENGATLQDGGVWVNNPEGKLMRIPITELELNSTDFKKQNCIPNMGTHYYYKMTPELSCEDKLPWFVLTSGGVMIGTGFQVFGRLTLPPEGQRDWFERPAQAARAAQVTIPLGPRCLQEWAGAYGVVSLHIYYIDKPWKIHCSAGDSVQLAPAYDRILINGQRYATQVVDEIKKLFSG